jgi:hypothetical protein
MAARLTEPTDAGGTRATLRGGLQRLLDASAADWGVSRTTMAIILLVPFGVVGGGILALLLGKDAYKWYIEEDRFAENLQVAGFAVAALLSALTALRLRRAQEMRLGALFLMLAIGLFFIAGEEISWGQRILGLETPETLDEINRQGEINIHNIYPVEITLRIVQILFGVWGALLPLALLRYQDRFAKWRHELSYLIPHYSLVLYFAGTMVWRIYRFIHPDPPPEFSFVLSEWSEVMEFNLAIGFMLFALFQWRRLRSSGHGAL